MIRSSKHTLKFTNSGKLKLVKEFIDAYGKAIEFYTNYLWTTKIVIGEYVLDVANGLYDCPSMLPKLNINFQTSLSGRALKSASTQACGIVRAVLSKRKKDEQKLEWKKSKGIKDQRLERILQNPPTYPVVDNVHCELNSINCAISSSNNHFEFWLTLGSLFKDRRGLKVSLPIKNYDRAKYWQDKGKFLNGISLSKHDVTFRYEIETPELKKEGDVISIDQGKVQMLTTSRKDVFPEDKHGHTLSSIIDTLSKRKSGSKGFKRKQEHRKNYVNWLVKQLLIENVKEIKLEKITNIKYGRNTSRVLKHWSNPLIRDAILKLAEEEGVLLTMVENAFNSQRCNSCGWTQKFNRKGKLFVCRKCGHSTDADENATLNILQRHELFELPFEFWRQKQNINGFYWTNYGIFASSAEIQSRISQIKTS